VPKFWFKIWFFWALRFSLESVVFAAIFSSLISSAIYFLKGMPPLENDVVQALWKIFYFWFTIFWSVTLLLSLFRSVKYFFNHCYDGYVLKLFTCKGDEAIQIVGYADLSRLFRKWMISMMWSVSALMVLTSVGSYFNFASYGWYDIYVLYLFILISGAITIPLIERRCKQVRLQIC
jgi:hypothetical protein